MEREYGQRISEHEVYESATSFLAFYKLAIKQGLLMQFREKLVITLEEIKKRANQ
jgi:hypothetical protein